ncbi:MAG: ATP-binding cassette domain-containing protein, partial [Candidatus Acidiferrales bacterium]
MEKLLDVRDLRIRYSCGDTPAHQAVDGIRFEIAPGEVVGLMGESGCGKSTLALAILGLLPRESCEVRGSILFCGRELIGMPEHELQEIRGAGISLVFQEPAISLSPVMRVGDQVAEVIHAHRRGNWKSCRTESESMLSRVGLTPT